MADGSAREQLAFHLPHHTAVSRLRPGEIAVVLSAGGGGASHALETALARAVDIAINHNPWAVGMHAANHPYTRHLCQDVWEADPRGECGGRPVGVMHASPDCTHFSQAKGGQPRSRATRSLSWVVLRWAGTVRPRIIPLENVREILKWGPLIAKRCKATGRVVRLDGSVAAPGERVPIEQQFLIPDKRHEGRTWRQFVAALEALGYQVEAKRVRACDHGAGTSRERLFMVARCDGEPIRWPEPSHGPGRPLPYVSAADCIDWSIPCPSIFIRSKPLADATLRRIARGVRRYVLDAAEPFIVGVGGRMGQTQERPVSGPLQTVTAKADSAVVAPTLVQCANTTGHPGAAADSPVPTITSAGNQAVVACTLSPEHEAGALRVAAFLMRYYGTGGQWGELTEPLSTITTKDRLALVTVQVGGVPHVIVDIGLRMLKPHELYRAQGFPPDYIIDRTADGRPLSTSRAVAMVGNSVSPPPLHAILTANLDAAFAPMAEAA